MWNVLISIGVVSGLAAVLAALLVVAERYVVKYGQCDIDVNGQRQFTVPGGEPLLSVLGREKIFIPSACGGRGTCAYCKVKVLTGGGPVSPTETPFLTKDEVAEGIRLSCQVKIRQATRIEIAPELLSVKEYLAVVEAITDLTYDIKRFRLRLQAPATIDFIAGQYIQLLAPRYKGNSEEVYRAYSIASDPACKDVVELIVRKVPNGICTTYCFEYLKVGDPVRFNGPYGEFHLSDTDAEIIFVAGGSGMAPIECLLHHMRNTRSPRRATYYFGGNTTRDMFMSKEMKQFEVDLTGFTYVPTVANVAEHNGWDGERGLVTEIVERHVKDRDDMEAYLCGSPGMIDAAADVLNRLGIPEDRIFYDKFS